MIFILIQIFLTSVYFGGGGGGGGGIVPVSIFYMQYYIYGTYTNT